MNDAMRRLDGLVGEWDVTMTHAWFLDSLDTEINGSATFEWLADAFLVAFSHDDRGVYRVFGMTFADGEWTLLREDPDFHQRVVMRAAPDRIDLRADASDDAGQTWRKDLDYIFERRHDPEKER